MTQPDPELERELAELRRNIRVSTWEFLIDVAIVVALMGGVALLLSWAVR